MKDKFGDLDHRVSIKKTQMRRKSERNPVLSNKKANTVRSQSEVGEQTVERYVQISELREC